MRVYGPNGTALATAPLTARRTEGGTFTVSEQEATPNSPAATTLRSISTLDALIALQGVENPAERIGRSIDVGAPEGRFGRADRCIGRCRP